MFLPVRLSIPCILQVFDDPNLTHEGNKAFGAKIASYGSDSTTCFDYRAWSIIEVLIVGTMKYVSNLVMAHSHEQTSSAGSSESI